MIQTDSHTQERRDSVILPLNNRWENPSHDQNLTQSLSPWMLEERISLMTKTWIMDKILVTKKRFKDWNTDPLNARGEICWYNHWSAAWQKSESWTWGKWFTDPLKPFSLDRKWQASPGYDWKDSLSQILIYWKKKAHISQHQKYSDSDTDPLHTREGNVTHNQEIDEWWVMK